MAARSGPETLLWHTLWLRAEFLRSASKVVLLAFEKHKKGWHPFLESFAALLVLCSATYFQMNIEHVRNVSELKTLSKAEL